MQRHTWLTAAVGFGLLCLHGATQAQDDLRVVPVEEDASWRFVGR